jgi:hypothetical protein
MPVMLTVSPLFPVTSMFNWLPVTEPLIVPTDEQVVPNATWSDDKAPPF